MQPTVIWPGEFPEASLIEWGKQLLDPHKSFIDVGAHVGTYALSYAPHCLCVHAFEPQEITFYRLCTGIIMNRLTNVHARNVALAAEENREAFLSIISQDGGGSSIKSLPINQKPLRREVVECRTLDSYKLEGVGLIKIDVEGAELEVLKGAEETLRRERPKLLIEVWTEDWYREQREKVSEMLKYLGYKHQTIRGYPHMWIAEPLAGV